MGLLTQLNPLTPTQVSESSGYYERVPIRVGEFVLVENNEGEVVFQTSAKEFCGDGPMLEVRITSDGGWSVDTIHGPYHSTPVPAVDLSMERVERRRAFWHAAQYMMGRDLSHSERYSSIHRTYNDDSEIDLFEDDAFFKNGDPVTSDPFGEFLKN